MITQEAQEVIDALVSTRRLNIAIYAKIADMIPEAEKLGWRVRRPEDPDTTMLIVERGLLHAHDDTAHALTDIATNDEEIMRLMRILIGALAK